MRDRLGSTGVALLIALVCTGTAQARPGDAYLLDDSANPDALYRITPGGTVVPVGPGVAMAEYPTGAAFDHQGRFLIADQVAGDPPDNGAILRIDPATGAAAFLSTNSISEAAGGAAAFRDPMGIAVAPNGDLIVTTRGGTPAVVRVNPRSGRQTVITSGEELDTPIGVAVLPTGAIYVGDYDDGQIIRVAGGSQSVVASGLGTIAHLAVQAYLRILVVQEEPPAGAGGAVLRFNPLNGRVTTVSSDSDLGAPFGIGRFFDQSVALADWGTQEVQKVSLRTGAGGPITTAAFINPLALAVQPPRCGGRTATFYGTSNAEVIRGSASADVIFAGLSNDVIKGLGKGDVLCGGRHRDELLGGRGNDRLLGGRARDRLRGGTGRDRLIGGADRYHDLLLGGPGPDRLLGGPGPDLLIGGPGPDLLIGGPGNDRCIGRGDRKRSC